MNVNLILIVLVVIVSIIVCATLEYISTKREAKFDRYRQSIWVKLDIRAEKASDEYTNRMHISINEVIHTLDGIWTPDTKVFFEVYKHSAFVNNVYAIKIDTNIAHVWSDQ